MSHGQVSLSKIDEICPLAIPNQISTISIHIPSLVKIHWYLLKLSSRNKNLTYCRQIMLSKIDEICPLAISSQITTISMHIQCLVKIHWHLRKLSSGNENMDLMKFDHWQSQTRFPLYQCKHQVQWNSENPLIFTQVIIWKWKYGQMDGQTDRWTHRPSTWNHNTPPLLCGRV